MIEQTRKKTHWPRNLGDVAYRIGLLRRVILMCVYTVALGLVVGVAVHGGGLYFSSLIGLVLVIGVTVAVSALHAVAFPSGTMDALALSITAAIWIICLPFLTPYFDGRSPLPGLVLVVLGPVLTWLAVAWLLVQLVQALPRGKKTIRISRTVPVSAEALGEHLLDQPNRRTATRRTGPVDRHGFFPVWYGFAHPNEATGFEASDDRVVWDRSPDIYVKLLEEGPLFQVSHAFEAGKAGLNGGGARWSVVARTQIEPITDSRCRLTSEERYHGWEASTSVMAWLNDYERDQFREIVDAVNGVPSPAVRRLPQVTLMSVIASKIAQIADAPSGGETF
ncbi:hypothetical protein [Marimonas arenosa]|uniref:Uncharacterized protein n=1 Tax=Marimonas arenosa TaxID=1795305 RepID=A0AAE4B4V7_9RHOB|nr:hypothetical protein [Marimonas arenosa]MDQ2089764.1 hypothetical protein [Marimonas arenosa]